MGNNTSKDNQLSENQSCCEYSGDANKTIGLPLNKVQRIQNSKYVYYNIPPEETKKNIFTVKLKYCNYLNYKNNDECTINLKTEKPIKNIIDNIEYFDIKKSTDNGTFIYRYNYTKSVKSAQIIYCYNV